MMSHTRNRIGRPLIKIIPIILIMLVISGALAVVLSGLLRYSQNNKPDMECRLSPVDEGLPADFRSRIAMPVSVTRAERNCERLITCGEPQGAYDEGSGNYTVALETWVYGKDITAHKSVIYFDFGQGMPQFLTSRIDPPDYRDVNHLPITILATFDNEVRVIACFLDADLNIVSTSKTSFTFPPDATAAKVNLSRTVKLERLNIPDGNVDYIAYGVGLSEAPGNRDEWMADHSADELNPAMQSTLGVIITRADTDGWVKPYKIFETPHAGEVDFLKPFGWPGLGVVSGAPGNGWYTLPPEDMGADRDNDGVQDNNYLFRKNEDIWTSIYLIDINSGEYFNRLRLGETHPELRWPYNCYTATSGHSKGTMSDEMAVIGWPVETPDEGKYIYAYHSTSNSETTPRGWKFVPEDGHKIAYEKNPDKCYAIEDIDERIGFVLINDDGSVDALQQPDFFEPQEHQWSFTLGSGDASSSRVDNFSGLVTLHNGRNGYVFTTDDSRLIVLNPDGSLVQDTPIAKHFTGDTNSYQTSSPVYKGWGALVARYGYPAAITLGFNDNFRVYQLGPNERSVPGWRYLIIAIWVLAALIWTASLYLLLRHRLEATFIPMAEHESLVAAEKNETRAERERQSFTAHEIRNPLQAIKGFAKMLKDDATDTDQAESAGIIVKEAERLDIILKRLLDYSRELKVNPQDIELRQWWDEIKPVAEEMAHPDSISIQWSDPPEKTSRFDPDLIRQVFINLYKNALEASSDGGSIKASLATSNGNVVMRIEDHGPGITKEGASQAFESYQTTKVGGSGIGLPFSKRIIKAHGGDIDFDLGVSKGAAIEVKWPIDGKIA